MKSKTIIATQTDKLVNVIVEDGEIVCSGRKIIDIDGKKIRGPVENITISKWPFDIDGEKFTKKKILNILESIYEMEVG